MIALQNRKSFLPDMAMVVEMNERVQFFYHLHNLAQQHEAGRIAFMVCGLGNNGEIIFAQAAINGDMSIGTQLTGGTHLLMEVSRTEPIRDALNTV
jgi:hypothetical protein